MKCMSCQANIPPEWVHAINSNICPGCGGDIMDDTSKRLLGELREAMNQMPNNPEGLAGWLLSNYHLNKVGTAEPTHFHERRGTTAVQTSSEDIQGSPAGPSTVSGKELANKFLQRANVQQVAKNTEHFKNLVNKIKNGGGEDLIVDDDGMDDVDTSEPIDASDLISAISTEDKSPLLRVGKMKREESLENILSGSRGVFRRSG